jgi:dCTP deaminase
LFRASTSPSKTLLIFSGGDILPSLSRIGSILPYTPTSNSHPALAQGNLFIMLMSDRDIRSQIEQGRIGLDPLEMSLLQPSSMDVRLDRFFRLFDNHKYAFIDPAIDQPDLTRLIEVEPDEAFILHPGEFVLASTYEVITLPDDIAGRLEGKSSLGRLGLLTHSTAGFIDPGFSGHITLELSNVANLPVKLFPGMKIGQLCLIKLSSPAENPYGSALYGSRYQGQRGPTASKSWLNFHQSEIK